MFAVTEHTQGVYPFSDVWGVHLTNGRIVPLFCKGKPFVRCVLPPKIGDKCNTSGRILQGHFKNMQSE